MAARSGYNPGKSAFTRVFITEGRARPDHSPEYQSCMRAGSVSQSFGDIERIECPSDAEYGQFDEVGRIQGAIERASSSLVGRYAADLASELLRLAKARCATDVDVHFGACTDPRRFNTFTKALKWEDVSLPNYSTDDLGALSSDENAAITETSDLSIGQFYEILPLSVQERAVDTVINELVDAVICDRRTCGDCDELSDGCEKAFVLQGGLTGSPGTGPDVIYTSDKGLNWASDEILTLASDETATAIACIEDYVFVTSNDAGSISWKSKATLLAGTAGGWIEVTTGIVTGGEPNDAWSVGVGAYVVGDGGYVYYTEDPSTGVSVLDAGIATTQNLNCVHALDDELAIAGGQSDTIIYTTNRVTWQAATATGGGGNIQAVWMIDEDIWWAVDDNGDAWYTVDQGVTWTEKALPGSTPSALYDIQFPTKAVGFIAGVASSIGALYRTYDGGHTWVKMPEGVGTLPGSSTKISAIATCIHDVNYLIVAGEDSGSDGVLLVAED